MARRKKKLWRPIVTEDEVFARDAAKKARVEAASQLALEKLTSASKPAARRNPLSYVGDLLQPIWTCTISLYGLLLGDWSPASVIVCFWFEKLTRVTLVAARIYIHREATHKRGHYRKQLDLQLGTKDWETNKFHNAPIGSGSLLKEFIHLSILTEVLTLGVMVWGLSSMQDWTHSASSWAFVKQEWLSKAWIIVLPLVVQFAIDVIGPLRQQSFASVKVLAVVTNRTANLVLTAFLLALWLSNYIKLPNLTLLVCGLIGVKSIYEVSLVMFGRDWELKWNDGISGRLWKSDPEFVKYANEETRLRAQDEAPLK